MRTISTNCYANNVQPHGALSCGEKAVHVSARGSLTPIIRRASDLLLSTSILIIVIWDHRRLKSWLPCGFFGSLRRRGLGCCTAQLSSEFSGHEQTFLCSLLLQEQFSSRSSSSQTDRPTSISQVKTSRSWSLLANIQIKSCESAIWTHFLWTAERALSTTDNRQQIQYYWVCIIGSVLGRGLVPQVLGALPAIACVDLL